MAKASHHIKANSIVQTPSFRVGIVKNIDKPTSDDRREMPQYMLLKRSHLDRKNLYYTHVHKLIE